MGDISRFLRAFAANESGTTAVEYGLIVALIFLAIIGGVQSTGAAVGNTFTAIANAIGSALGG